MTGAPDPASAPPDAGLSAAEPSGAGQSDAGQSDAGQSDAGPSGAGPPDPAEAATNAEFVETLVRLRRWAGEPPLSRLRVLGGQARTPDGDMVDALPKSTTSTVLRQSDRLPRWDFVKAFVTACLRYGDMPAEAIPAELERWRSARAALTEPCPPQPPPPTGTAGPTTGTALGSSPERAVELLVRRVWKEEDRARKGLLGGYSSAPVSYPGGDLTTIGAYYRGLRHGRLLVVGEPGAGKTVLAIELVLQLLEPYLGRPAGTPVVPVRLDAARWTLGAPFETWLAAQLVRDFGLGAGDAERLVRDRRVLPVLDGLDELDPGPSKRPRRAIGLLTELNRYSHRSGREPGPLVVTCRADRYAELAEARAALDGAALIELNALTTGQIGAYLRERWPEGHPCAADGAVVRTALAGPAVYAALATPWRLLLTVTAVESGTDPATLLETDPGDDPGEAAARIAGRLLAGYIPAATRLTPRGGTGRTYEPEHVQTWLTNLAGRLRFQATDTAELRHPGQTPVDLVPHLLWPIAGRRRVQLLHGLCGGLLAILAMVAFSVGSALSPDPLTLALMGGWVAIAIRLSVSRWPAASGGRAEVPPRRRLAGGLLGGVAGLAVGVLGGLTGLMLTAGQVFGLGFALPAGAAGGTVLGAVIGVTAAGRPSGQRLSVREVARTQPGLVLGFGLCGALTSLPPVRLAHAAPWEMALGVSAGFVLAVVLGMVFAFATGGWSEDTELAHPREALRRNGAIGLAFGLIGAVAAVLVFSMNQGILVSAGCALVGGVSFGLAFGAIAWSRSMLGLLVAAARGLLPLRLWTFLDWACEARLLRVSGATYQFRHRELQDFLTGDVLPDGRTDPTRSPH